MLLILIRESAKETLYCSIEAQCTRGRGTYVTIFDIAIFVFVIIFIIIIHITIIIITIGGIINTCRGTYVTIFDIAIHWANTIPSTKQREKHTKHQKD